MKLATALLELTGDPVYADCIEQSFYNSYMGAMNTQRVPAVDESFDTVPQVLPFDSYSPLTSDVRGRQVGGFNTFEDKTFYGCCACIGAAGAGVIPEVAVMSTSEGLVINHYERGVVHAKTPAGKNFDMNIATAYPYDGRVEINISVESKEKLTLALRVPAWCDEATVSVNGNAEKVSSGYLRLEREWSDGDSVVLDMPMPITRILPPEGALNSDTFAGYRRGPIVLAADKIITDPDRILDIRCDGGNTVKGESACCHEIPEAKMCMSVELSGGEHVRLIDYASAGKTWTEESKCAAWLRRK